MAKTKAQLEKKKREVEKRKKLDKVILKIAASMPDDVQDLDPVKSIAEPTTAAKPI